MLVTSLYDLRDENVKIFDILSNFEKKKWLILNLYKYVISYIYVNVNIIILTPHDNWGYIIGIKE